MANHQSLPQHGKPSPTLSLMLKEFTEKNLRRPGFLVVSEGVWLTNPKAETRKPKESRSPKAESASHRSMRFGSAVIGSPLLLNLHHARTVTGRIKRDHLGSKQVPFGDSKSPTWGFNLVFRDRKSTRLNSSHL